MEREAVTIRFPSDLLAKVRSLKEGNESLNDLVVEAVEHLLQKKYSLEDLRKTHPRAYAPWSKDEDERLRQRYEQGVTINNLSIEFERQPGGIRSRLTKMGLR